MIIDITGIELTPGNNGDDCLGNGQHYDISGEPIEIYCDECNYFLCCISENWQEMCKECIDAKCPRCKKP